MNELDAIESLARKLVEANEKIHDEYNNQRKKELKWKKWKFFLLATFIFAGGALYVQAFITAFGGAAPRLDDYAAVVKIDGPIVPGARNSAEKVNSSLDQAFNDDKAKGIVLLVNSPGGSPVQAALIADHIKRLRKEHPDKVIVTVAEDVLASGAYMAAMGTDEIYAHRSTIAGSIGVVAEGFGFPELLDKVGLERRVLTAGKYKRRLDPYLKVQPEDVEVTKKRLKKIHNQFIAMVKASRGDKLKADDATLFTGDVWTGEEALALGLIDGISDVDAVIRDKFDVKYYYDKSQPPSFVDQLVGAIKTQVSVWLSDAQVMQIMAK